MKPTTAKYLSKALSGVAVLFAFVVTKLVVGTMETPSELHKK